MNKKMKKLIITGFFIIMLIVPASASASTGTSSTNLNYFESFLDKVSSLLQGNSQQTSDSNSYYTDGWKYDDHDDFQKIWEEWCKKYQDPPKESIDIWRDWYCNWDWKWDWNWDWGKDWDDHDKDWDYH